MVQMVKNLHVIWETWVQSLGWEDLWRRAWQLTPVLLPGESPWTEEPGGLQSMGLQRVGHDWATKCMHARARTHTHTHTHTSKVWVSDDFWELAWNPNHHSENLLSACARGFCEALPKSLKQYYYYPDFIVWNGGKAICPRQYTRKSGGRMWTTSFGSSIVSSNLGLHCPVRPQTVDRDAKVI